MFDEQGGPFGRTPKPWMSPPAWLRAVPLPRPAVRPSLCLPSLLGLHEEVEVGPGKLLVDAVE